MHSRIDALQVVNRVTNSEITIGDDVRQDPYG